jgi:hypothetical protein
VKSKLLRLTGIDGGNMEEEDEMVQRSIHQSLILGNLHGCQGVSHADDVDFPRSSRVNGMRDPPEERECSEPDSRNASPCA